jgi:PleD family two-component response regulator
MGDTKILILDNYTPRVEHLSALLDKAGYRVFQASQLSISLEMLKEDKTDIILVGDSLEDTTMVDLCRALKSNMATKDIATIACFSTIQRASANLSFICLI